MWLGSHKAETKKYKGIPVVEQETIRVQSLYTMTSQYSSQTLHFGVLLFPNYQWLDAAGPVDYINNHSQAYLKFCQDDGKTVAKAPIIVWHYISSDLELVHTTSGPPGYPTCTYADCPEIDYLIVPGPDLTMRLPEGCGVFLQRIMASVRVKAILTVCTGALAVAQSGILDGLNVCSNKYSLKLLKKAGLLDPKVKWVGDRRWMVDGKIWSAAGITAGLDLAAEFARVHFHPDIVAIVRDVAEYEPRPAQPDPFARILDGVVLP